MAFSKREQSFCVLENARTSSVVTVLAANQGGICASFPFKETWRVSLSIGVRITTILYVVYLLWIYKIFHGLKNKLLLTSDIITTHSYHRVRWIPRTLKPDCGPSPNLLSPVYDMNILQPNLTCAATSCVTLSDDIFVGRGTVVPDE
jgi:hypothetical protein